MKITLNEFLEANKKFNEYNEKINLINHLK